MFASNFTRLLAFEVALSITGIIVLFDSITTTIFFYANGAAVHIAMETIATLALVSAIVHRRTNTRCRRCTLLLHSRFVGLASSNLAICLRSAGITWVTIWKPDLCEPQ
jgi:hypothetical protein